MYLGTQNVIQWQIKCIYSDVLNWFGTLNSFYVSICYIWLALSDWKHWFWSFKRWSGIFIRLRIENLKETVGFIDGPITVRANAY